MAAMRNRNLLIASLLMLLILFRQKIMTYIIKIDLGRELDGITGTRIIINNNMTTADKIKSQTNSTRIAEANLSRRGVSATDDGLVVNTSHFRLSLKYTKQARLGHHTGPSTTMSPYLHPLPKSAQASGMSRQEQHAGQAPTGEPLDQSSAAKKNVSHMPLTMSRDTDTLSNSEERDESSSESKLNDGLQISKALSTKSKKERKAVAVPTNETEHNSSQFDQSEEAKKMETLMITHVTDDLDWVREGDAEFRQCHNLQPHMRCIFSHATQQVWNKSHAVIFRPFHFKESTIFPNYRPPFQKWIFDEHESPLKTWNNFRLNQTIWKHFNISITYTEDATIPFYMYGFECQVNNSKEPSGINFGREKSRDVLWLAGNCGWTSGREYYVAELGRHIPVDVYGRCGRGQVCGEYGQLNHTCVKDLLSKYRFYLAFENSFCEDYYTEKIGKTLNMDVVPVVMGLTNYTRLLTPHTFIDVRDFTSPKALAKYLKYFSRNDTAYNQYIERKRQVVCKKKYQMTYFCDLCRHLHLNKERVETLPDARRFWGHAYRCQGPARFFRGIADSLLNNTKLQLLDRKLSNTDIG